jgi:hypothetical protein
MMSDGPGNSTPGGTSLFFTNGQILEIQAIPFPPDPKLIPVTTNHFVRWLGDAHAIIANPAAAHTTVQLTGDSLLIAQFSVDKDSYTVNFVAEGNGSFEGANSLTQVVQAGGDCSPVTALPDLGYAFAGWGGDYPATDNPLTVTNVQMDTTVIAFFWPAPPAISFQRVGLLLNLTWPANAPGYVLESAGTVSGGPWSLVPGVTTNSVTLPISSTNQFFRLKQGSDQSP